MTLHQFDVELAKMSSFVTKHSKQRKNQKWSKHNDFASIWCQNDQNNVKLPNRSNYDELHGFDVELAKMSSSVTKHSKQRKTPKVIKVQWLCIDLMSKWSKQRKTTKLIKLRWIAWIWRRISKNVEFCHKTFKTTQNSKSDQNTMTLHRFDVKMIKTTQNYQSDQMTMNCMHLTSNWQKCRVLSQNIQNNAKLQKWSKYNDFASIWCQNDQNNAKLPKRSNYDELHEFDVELAKMSSFVTKHSKQRKTPKVIKIQWLESIWCRIVKNVEFCHKTFKTTQNSKSDQNTMTWIDLMSNWQKCRVLSQNIQNTVKLQKWSKYNDFASIWCQNDQKNAKLPKRSNDDELHAFDIELAKMSSFVTKHSKQRKTPKVIKVQWLCIDLMSKWSKQRKTTKAIKWRWIACIWRRIGKNVEFCHKTFKTTQNSKSDQNTMTWIDLMSNSQKCRVLSQNIQNNAKLQKWSKYNDLNRFDVEFAKMSSFVTKHSKQRKTTKAIKLRWIACIWRRIGENVEFCHKTFKTTQNSKSDQNTMTWIDLTSNWQKCRVLSQNIQNNAKLQKWSKYNDLNRFDVELAKMSSFVTKHSKHRKTPPKVIKVQWLCIDVMSKWSKQRKTTKAIKWRWIACIWHRIGKNVEFCHKTFNTTQNSKSDQNTMTWIDLMSNCQKCRVFHKTFNTTQNSKSDQNTMTWIDLMSNCQKCRVLSKNIQNNA